MDTNDQNQMLTLAKLSWYFNSLKVLGEEGAKENLFPNSVQTSRLNGVDQRDLSTFDVLTNMKSSSVCFVIKCQLVWPPIPTNAMGNQEKESQKAERLQISTCHSTADLLWWMNCGTFALMHRSYAAWPSWNQQTFQNTDGKTREAANESPCSTSRVVESW